MDILNPLTPNIARPLDMRKRVLVVEDEDEIRQLIVLHLRREGFEVEEANDGEVGRKALESRPFDLVVLDWMLPSFSGLDLCRWLRKRSPHATTPVLFVTAKTEPEHVATGLDAGADDYIAKPFDTLVLMARVNALLRRQDWLREKAAEVPSSAKALLSLGDLVLNTDTYEVTLMNQKLDLTRSEFRLLEALLTHQGKVLSRESLIGEIQGENVNVVGRTIDTHVFGLRKKLGPYADAIETIRGVGYRVRYIPGVN